jgi:hypothetical protein
VPKWFDLVGEIFDTGGCLSTDPIRFFAVPALQQPFYRGCCFYCNRLFMEFLFNLSPHCAALEKTRLVYGFPGTIGNTIACCWVHLDLIQNLLLFMYCVYLLGFVVGVSTSFVVS